VSVAVGVEWELESSGKGLVCRGVGSSGHFVHRQIHLSMRF